jgi:hypothetical protein
MTEGESSQFLTRWWRSGQKFLLILWNLPYIHDFWVRTKLCNTLYYRCCGVLFAKLCINLFLILILNPWRGFPVLRSIVEYFPPRLDVKPRTKNSVQFILNVTQHHPDAKPEITQHQHKLRVDKFVDMILGGKDINKYLLSYLPSSLSGFGADSREFRKRKFRPRARLLAQGGRGRPKCHGDEPIQYHKGLARCKPDYRMSA